MLVKDVNSKGQKGGSKHLRISFPYRVQICFYNFCFFFVICNILFCLSITTLAAFYRYDFTLELMILGERNTIRNLVIFLLFVYYFFPLDALMFCFVINTDLKLLTFPLLSILFLFFRVYDALLFFSY